MAPYLHILEDLGWNDGMYIPVANEENKILEKLLESRNKELQKLKDEWEEQKAKRDELDYHRKNIQNEHKKNMQLLAIYKEELDQEENFDKLTSNELSKISQDIMDFKKQSADISDKNESVQSDIAQVLKKIETLRSSIGEDRESLEQWRAALNRSEADLEVINDYQKEDNSLLHQLEIKRQRLKVECDKKKQDLSRICNNLDAEEKSAERVSQQVMEALNRRRSLITTWSEAIENLRQRDRNIKHVKEKLQMYKEYTKNRAAHAEEKQEFLEMQKSNNAEAERELSQMNKNLSVKRQELSDIKEIVNTLENEVICTKRQLANTSNELHTFRMDNKKMTKEIQMKENSIRDLNEQIRKYKEKLSELADGSKTAAQRLRQLEDMFNNEDKYLKQINLETNRIQNRLILAQRQLSALKEEEDNYLTDIKGYKASMLHLESIESKIRKDLEYQQDNLDTVNYQLEVAKVRLAKLDGHIVDEIDRAALNERFEELKSVLGEKISTVNLLNSQIIKLEGEHRLLAKNIAFKQEDFENLHYRLRGLTAETDGITNEEQILQKSTRSLRADLSGLQLQTSHMENIIKNLCNKGDSVARAQLDLSALVNEKIVEAKEKQSVLSVQKRVLQDERSSLIASIKAEQSKLEQLKKRYEIYVSTLGEDENGEALSVTYFKIKHAQEKSELQQQGDSLDAEIKKGEEEIAALESTLQVIDATNKKYFKSLGAAQEDDPELVEYNNLCDTYDMARNLRSKVISKVKFSSKEMEDSRKEIKQLEEQIEELHDVRDNLIDELKILEKDLKDQIEKLHRANEYRKKSRISARKKIKNLEIWNIHEKDIRTKELIEANRSAESQLRAVHIPIVNKRALEYGINLQQTFSAPSNLKMNIPSTASSIVSEQESWEQDITENTSSKRSIYEEYSDVSDSKRLEISSGISQISSIQAKNGVFKMSRSQGTPGASLPISVVVLGSDVISKNGSKTIKKSDKGKSKKKTAPKAFNSTK